MPNRINRAIELLEQGQPIYYIGSHTGAELTYEAGKKMAKTWADYINIGMEHGPFDMAGLCEFMRGLVDGGPTNSGHRTPTVIVEAPVDGSSEEVIREGLEGNLCRCTGYQNIVQSIAAGAKAMAKSDLA